MPKFVATEITKAAKPTRTFFDPWNSASTGHQRAENRLSGSTSWRDSRSSKLAEQFKDGQRGGKRMFDAVGAGSDTFGTDGRLENGGWALGASGLRKGGQQSILKSFHGGKGLPPADYSISADSSHTLKPDDASGSIPILRKEGSKGSHTEDSHRDEPEAANVADLIQDADSLPVEKQIFRGLVIYINGSTYPLISDHKLKRLLATHGARLSTALGRRTVTHVIIGTPNDKGKGAGGGLAGGKIQKEIATVKGAGVKFVGVEWILESIKAGKRLPESKFVNLKLASKGQGSVYGMFGGDTKS